LFSNLEEKNIELNYENEVENLNQHKDGSWEVKVKNLKTEEVTIIESDFVFIGAGGASLRLLQKKGIKESKYIVGLPVRWLFLVCRDESITSKHLAKVYGKAAVGAPPMSVPHLDTRYIDGQRTLLFGPFAGFSPKFLKTGSNMDLIKSVKPNNLITM